MRVLVLLLLVLSTLAAAGADLRHCRVVMHGGTEYVGWWDADARAMYLPNGRYAYLPDNSAIARVTDEAPAKDQAKPAKRQFPLPEVVFARVRYNGIEYTGWYIPVSFNMHVPRAAGQDPEAVGLGAETVILERLAAPGPMPERVLRQARHDAVALASEIAAARTGR